MKISLRFPIINSVNNVSAGQLIETRNELNKFIVNEKIQKQAQNNYLVKVVYSNKLLWDSNGKWTFLSIRSPVYLNSGLEFTESIYK